MGSGMLITRHGGPRNLRNSQCINNQQRLPLSLQNHPASRSSLLASFPEVAFPSQPPLMTSAPSMISVKSLKRSRRPLSSQSLTSLPKKSSLLLTREDLLNSLISLLTESLTRSKWPSSTSITQNMVVRRTSDLSSLV
jgi:hypothetical protein